MNSIPGGLVNSNEIYLMWNGAAHSPYKDGMRTVLKKSMDELVCAINNFRSDEASLALSTEGGRVQISLNASPQALGYKDTLEFLSDFDHYRNAFDAREELAP
ncbi:MAG: hypothetical protein HY094_08945 [Candidatus Melainabacteria bacterium]|nr:hypothetical protein [Candidatus Melainabacteria bacterium]